MHSAYFHMMSFRAYAFQVLRLAIDQSVSWAQAVAFVSLVSGGIALRLLSPGDTHSLAGLTDIVGSWGFLSMILAAVLLVRLPVAAHAIHNEDVRRAVDELNQLRAAHAAMPDPTFLRAFRHRFGPAKYAWLLEFRNIGAPADFKARITLVGADGRIGVDSVPARWGKPYGQRPVGRGGEQIPTGDVGQIWIATEKRFGVGQARMRVMAMDDLDSGPLVHLTRPNSGEADEDVAIELQLFSVPTMVRPWVGRFRVGVDGISYLDDG